MATSKAKARQLPNGFRLTDNMEEWTSDSNESLVISMSMTVKNDAGRRLIRLLQSDPLLTRML